MQQFIKLNLFVNDLLWCESGHKSAIVKQNQIILFYFLMLSMIRGQQDENKYINT